MSNHKKNGFAFLPVILIAGLLTILVVGWYVWHKQKGSTNNTISSFAECAAAGNPVQETFPEVCVSKDGQRFVNPDQSPLTPSASADETSGWLLYTPEDKAYSVRIPDGWTLVSYNGSIYGSSDKDIIYKAGAKATVTPVEGGWDGALALSLYNPGDYASQIVRQGAEQGQITTNQGLSVHKYYFVQTDEPDGLGYQKDDKVYNYYFDENGKSLQVEHVIHSGSTDQTATVEKLIKTIQIN